MTDLGEMEIGKYVWRGAWYGPLVHFWTITKNGLSLWCSYVVIPNKH